MAKLPGLLQNPVAGASVKIEVSDPSGKLYQNQGSTFISINGVPGTGQYLQFALAGDHKVPVTAIAADGAKEQTTTTITVAAPVLSEATKKALADPANAKLPAEQIAYLKATSDVRLMTVAQKAPYGTPHAVSFNLRPLIKFIKPPAAPSAKTGVTAGSSPTASTAAASASPDKSISWSWDFGDGSKPVTTFVPAADHDYAASLGSTQEFHFFDVTITELQIPAGGKDAVPTGQSWKRTLCVHNPYVAIKGRGYLVPTVTTKGSATKDGKNFVGTAEIKNIEPVPLTLRSRLIVPVLEDTSVLTAPTALEALASPIVVPANGSVTTKVSVPFSQVAEDAVGFKAIFTDEVAKGAKDDKTDSSEDAKSPVAGLKIRATAHFLVQPEYRGKAVAEDKKAGTDKSGMPAVKEGNQCDPDNLPSGVPANSGLSDYPEDTTSPDTGAVSECRQRRRYPLSERGRRVAGRRHVLPTDPAPALRAQRHHDPQLRSDHSLHRFRIAVGQLHGKRRPWRRR